VHARVPLARAVEALREVEQRRVQGKILIDMGGDA
jgi:hypothetical protein